MGRIVEQTIALPQRLAHQPEFAVFQIADTAMRHVRRCRTCARAEVSLIHQQRLHALQSQITVESDSIDTATRNQDCYLRDFAYRLEYCLTAHAALLFRCSAGFELSGKCGTARGELSSDRTVNVEGCSLCKVTLDGTFAIRQLDNLLGNGKPTPSI